MCCQLNIRHQTRGPAAELTQTDEAAGSDLPPPLARIGTSAWPDNVQLQRKTRHKMAESVMRLLMCATKNTFSSTKSALRRHRSGHAPLQRHTNEAVFGVCVSVSTLTSV